MSRPRRLCHSRPLPNQRSIVRWHLHVGDESHAARLGERVHGFKIPNAHVRGAISERSIEQSIAFARETPTVIERAIDRQFEVPRHDPTQIQKHVPHLRPAHDVQCIGGKYGVEAGQRQLTINIERQRRRRVGQACCIEPRADP